MKQSEMLEAAWREYDDTQVQAEVLRILEPGNEFLQDLVDDFGKTRSQAHKAQVACFYELKPSNVGAIVGRQARTVCHKICIVTLLIIFLEVCGEREFRLSRPLRIDREIFSLTNTL